MYFNHYQYRIDNIIRYKSLSNKSIGYNNKVII